MQQVLPALLRFAFDELNLHRIEMRLVASGTQDAFAARFGLFILKGSCLRSWVYGQGCRSGALVLVKTDPH